MDRLDAIKIFVRVVESGSFSSVARELGVRQPAISKQVAGLEAHLGAQLLLRTSRNLSVTEAGRDFYESASRLIGDLEAAESRVGRGQTSPAGKVRVTAAPAFSRLYVVPRLREFFARYPDVCVEMLVSERTSNLVEEGIDLAIRNGKLADSNLVARKIGSSPVVCVASTAYLSQRGEPAKPGECEDHEAVLFVSQDGTLPWKLGKHPWSHQPRGSFRTNDGEQLREAVLAGLGIAQAPLWLFSRDIAAGSVKRILVDYEPEPIPISVVRPPGKSMAGKVAVFIEFLVDLLADLSRT
ncbi:MAG TPA: LysR family transcriptional regulator [Pseudomonadales bacterium]